MTPKPANDDFAPPDLDLLGQRTLCKRCETGSLYADRVTVALPGKNGPVMVRNVPAMVCAHCGEEFVGSCTAEQLKHMHFMGISPEIVSVCNYGHDAGLAFSR